MTVAAGPSSEQPLGEKAMSKYAHERRREEADRNYARALAILAERLPLQGRAPASYTSDELLEALAQAADEFAPEQPAVDRDRLVSSPGARAAVDARAQAILAARGTDVTAETYLAACLEAENELYPRSAFDG
jgi:hypothetical protein